MLRFSKETTHLLEHVQILLLQLTVHLYYNINVAYRFKDGTTIYIALRAEVVVIAVCPYRPTYFKVGGCTSTILGWGISSCLLVNAMDGALHEYPEIS